MPYLTYRHPNGDIKKWITTSDWKSVVILDTPSTYNAYTVGGRWQLFNSAGVAATSEWSTSSTFKVYNVYTNYWVPEDDLYVQFFAGTTLDLSSYRNYEDLVLVPVISYRYAEGYFVEGANEYNCDITVTGNANWPTGTGTNTSLASQFRYLHCPSKWTEFNGKTLIGGAAPGQTHRIQLEGVNWTEGTSFYIKGLYSHKTKYSEEDTKTVASLPIPDAPPDSVVSHTVTLTSDGSVAHSNETLTVKKITSYAFDYWSTKSDGSDVVSDTTAPLENTTYYAMWKSTTTNNTVLPQWTSTSTMKYGDTAYDNYTLSCYRLKSDTTPWYTHTSSKYEFKPAKHTGWKSGSTTYTIGSVVSLSSGSTYTAVWEPDASGTSTYELSNTTLLCPTPSNRSGYTYLGLASSSTAKVPDYTPGATITVTADTTLYAVWKADGTVQIYNNTAGKFETYQVVIYSESTGKWDKYIPKIGNGTDWNDIYINKE